MGCGVFSSAEDMIFRYVCVWAQKTSFRLRWYEIILVYVFDCTPDILHQEQILRFGKLSDQKVTIKKRFIDFIYGKTHERLSKVILENFFDELNSQEVYGLGYANGSIMADKYIRL